MLHWAALMKSCSQKADWLLPYAKIPLWIRTGNCVLMGWVDTNGWSSRKILIYFASQPDAWAAQWPYDEYIHQGRVRQRHVAVDRGWSGISLLAGAFHLTNLAVMWRCTLRSSKDPPHQAQELSLFAGSWDGRCICGWRCTSEFKWHWEHSA